ncbi:Velvet complex subunit B [Hypsizygus marmoreus]|uniref:Velvet complex subunit B n=1 Tax=Hypsizygus marmoreus TaxID=39966 RepID=A0A369JHL8_HYPMA|nr:Velvet complex subunit B [Hypsizygus marmoreus]
MIQQLNPRQTSSSLAPLRQVIQDGPEQWGQWHGQRHYSLQVVQHPLRARMCGFGDKDRRPLAPAAVAKMIVRRDDNTYVDVDDVDCSFFLVTVDLWSADGKHEMNLVLHPSSADRYVPPNAVKTRRRGTSTSAPHQRSSGNQTPTSQATPNPTYYRSGDQSGGLTTPSVPSQHAGYNGQSYFPPVSDNMSFPSTPYGSAPPETPTWGYPAQSPPVDRNTTFPPPILPSIHSFGRNPSNSGPESWQPETDTEVLPYRAWGTDTAYQPIDNTFSNAQVDPALRGANSDGRDNSAWAQTERYHQDGHPPPIDTSLYSPAAYTQQPPPPPPYYSSNFAPTVQAAPPPSSASSIPLPRHTYTRTLVGPLSANACRLLDEHRKPGIFFLFQDLSVRTEGTFRLRLRLMNVGAPPAPEAGATHVHNDVSPVLAQTFTEPFVVYSAKRFPGVPDTTALSIAFGNQGQKLPLRNRHGSSKRRRRDDSGSDDDSDGG